MRTLLIILITSVMVVGCAARTPVAPETGMPGLSTQQSSPSNDPHRLWGEWKLYFNAAHDKVDVVPKREARFHLNALKFLEEYCTDCLKIEKINNNGDGTIDLTVNITHPFKAHPEYTGFDVKGIIMFNGSHELNTWLEAKYGLVDLPYPITRVSWREMGDPQVLNADGYVRRWSLSYESGSNLPMFNYWKGKNATGEPTADVNAYLDFYTNEDRHMFATNSSVSRTYKIWLPVGKPVVAGYAVEACWEPPTITPVTDPIADFPTSANQPEPYHLKWVLNNGEPVKYQGDCCVGNGDCSDLRVEIKQWSGPIIPDNDYPLYHFWMYTSQDKGINNYLEPCEPPQDGIVSTTAFPVGGSDGDIIPGPGRYQWLACHEDQIGVDEYVRFAFDMVEFEVIE